MSSTDTVTSQLAINQLNAVYFVNSDLADLATLLAGVPQGAEVVLLDPTQDGLSQMLTALDGRSGLDAIHLIGHGASGMIDLGSSSVTAQTLTARAADIATLGRALSINGDILLYGCDVGEGVQGAAFIQQLATLSGADVAASTNLTGAAAQGGDWVLEAQTGVIEAQAIAPVDYSGVLGWNPQTTYFYGNVIYPWGLYVTADWDGGNPGISRPYAASNVVFYESYYHSDNEVIQWYLYYDAARAGSSWYILQDDRDSGPVNWYGTYYNTTPTASSGTLNITEGLNGASVTQTLSLYGIVADSETADNLLTYSGTGVVTGTSGTMSYTAAANQALKGTLLVATQNYSAFDGYVSGSSNVKVYVTYANDTIIWPVGPANQTWATKGAQSFNFGKGAQDPDTIDSVVSYTIVNVDSVATSTPPAWMKLTGSTLSVANLTPEHAGETHTFVVRATSNDGSTIDKTFTITTGTAAELNDLPTSVGPAARAMLEDDVLAFTAADFHFVDLDNTAGGSTAAGAVLTGVRIDSLPTVGHGVLEYNNGTAVTAVVAGQTLSTAELATLTFTPALNYFNLPGAEDSFTFSLYDGVDYASAPSTLKITVTAVNDVPYFTTTLTGDVAISPVTALTATLADTAVYDSSVNATGALTGTLYGNDVESGTSNISFSIRGGNVDVNAHTVTKAGLYGTLTLDTTSHVWAYAATNYAAINALPTGATALEAFDMQVIDAAGASSVQPLQISITGSNDTPVVATLIADQSFSGAGSWSYQIPAASITDAEGTGLTYTVQVVAAADGTGAVSDTIGASTIAGDGSLPSSWLTFDAATRTFSGNPSVLWGDAPLNLKVTATDSAGVAISDTFTLTLTNTGNQLPTVQNPLTWHAVAAPHEQTEVQFGDGTLNGETVIFAGTTITAGSDLTGAQLAAAVAGGSYTGYTVTQVGSTDKVLITAATGGNLTDLQASDFTGTHTGTATPTVTLQGGTGGWSYQIPGNTFLDAETNTLTYSAYTVVTDGSGAPTYTLISTSSGNALDFDPATATLSGNGTAASSTVVEIRVTDAAHTALGSYAASQLQLVVNTTAPVVGTVSAVVGAIPANVVFANGPGVASYTVPAAAFDITGGTGTTVSYSATLADGITFLPGWLSFNTNTGTFSGNPPNGALSIDVKVKATDSASNTDTTAAFTLGITAPNDVLVLTGNLSDITVTSGSVGFIVPLLFSDPDGGLNGATTTDGITYSATLADNSALPSWLVFDTGTRAFSGNPPAGTPYLNIKVTGTETAGGSTASTSFTLNLADSTAYAAAANNPGTLADITGTVALGQVLTAAAPVDADGRTLHTAVTYQWQASSNGSTWTDVAGARGLASTLTLAQTESHQQVRVQAFYSDNGGFAEAPVSNSVTVPAFNLAGVVTISGSVVPGQTLLATVSDANGLSGGLSTTATFQWYRGADVNFTPGSGNAIAGATSSLYTLVIDDGAQYLKAVASYTDAEGIVETPSRVSGQIQLGPLAPVAVNDTPAAVTENSGVLNATVGGASPTGNLLGNDTDANAGDTQTLTELRLGGIEGIGTNATETGGGTTLTLVGHYGTLVVTSGKVGVAPNAGHYTYTVDQNNIAVEALWAGTHLTETFNYSVMDSALLSDTGVLTLTINGANDGPTLINPLIDQVQIFAGAITNYSFVQNTFDTIADAAFSDIDTETLTYTAWTWNGSTTSALPSWLIFDPVTRTFSGNPPVGSPLLNVRVIASDGAITVSDDFMMTPPLSVGDVYTLPAPAGDFTVINDQGLPTYVTGVVDGKTATTTGASLTTFVNPLGSLGITNSGTGEDIITGLHDGSTVTTNNTGTGTITIEDPLGSVAVANSSTGTGTVQVNALNDGKTVTITGTKPVSISSPDGNLTVANNSTGLDTITGLLEAKVVTTTGSGATTISSPAGSLTVANNGSGLDTITGLVNNSTVNSTGNGGGNTTIASPAGNLTVHNVSTGTGVVAANGLIHAAIITTNGDHAVAIGSPLGSLTVANTGTGLDTITGLLADKTVHTTGTGDTTVETPAAGLILNNTGTGIALVTHAHNAAIITTQGTGPISIHSELLSGSTVNVAAAGNTHLTLDNDSTGDINVTGVTNNSLIHSTGSGTGASTTTINNPTGNLTLDNTGTSPVKITGFDVSKTLTLTAGSTANSVTEVVTPDGDLYVANNGAGLLKVTGLLDGSSVTNSASGVVSISAPVGDIYSINGGSGHVTVSGLQSLATVNTDGSGPQTVDLAANSSGSVTVHNYGTGLVDVVNINTGITVSFTGDHLTTINSLSGSVVLDNTSTGLVVLANGAATAIPTGSTITTTGTGPFFMDADVTVGKTINFNITANDKASFDNDGPGTVNIIGANNSKVVTSGDGPMTITNPTGNLIINNSGSGVVTVLGALDGTNIQLTNSGPVVINSVLASPYSITIDATFLRSVTADNDGTGTINVTHLIDGTLKNIGSGSGPTVVINPVGDMTLENTSGTSPVNITGFDAAKTLTVTGVGPTNISTPTGSMSVANSGSGLVTLTGAANVSTITTTGTGNTTLENPLGNVTVANSSTGIVKVNGANDDSVVTTTGDKAVIISAPDGNVTVANNGTGIDTVTLLLVGKTVTGTGNGATVVSDPAGDLTLHNDNMTGGVVSVTGVNADKIVTATGTGLKEVNAPDASVTVNSTGTGVTTVSGTLTGNTVTVGGTGPITVHSVLTTGSTMTVNASANQQNLTVDNDSTGAIVITGLIEGASLKSTGSGTAGTTTVVSPIGNLFLESSGSNVVTVTGFDAGKTLTVTGSANTIVSNPDGNAAVVNNGSGIVTLTGVIAGMTVSAGGSGLTNVSDPLGNLTLNNSSLTGVASVSGANTGTTVTTTGIGTKAINAPDGSLTVNSTGTGVTTVSGTLAASTITTQGTGPITLHSDLVTGTVTVAAGFNTHVTLDNDNAGAINVTGVTTGSTIYSTGSGAGDTTITTPVGNLTVNNTGVSAVKVTGFDTNSTFTNTGNDTSLTEIVNPDGNLTVANNGAGLLKISSLHNGNSVTSTGSGEVVITSPVGKVYSINNGTGHITVSGAANGCTINTTGNTGTQTVDLATLTTGQVVTVNNYGVGSGSIVDLINVDDGTTVTFAGTRATTVSNLSATGAGVTIESLSTGLISITDPNNGSKIITAWNTDASGNPLTPGSGQIAINTHLAAGEKITVDQTNNHNIQVTNSGAGLVEVLGNLSLDSNDAMAVTLNGTGTTVMTETGTVNLANTPLTLHLAAGFVPVVGDTITLIANDGTDAVVGTFAGLAEGAIVVAGSNKFKISYVGGSNNNDVVLTYYNAPAVITGDSTAALSEANALQSTGGTLVAVDEDSSNLFVVQTGVDGASGYGKFSIDASGAWTYAMNTAHDEFSAGTDYTDSITVTTADGTPQVITVTIHGTNDVPGITVEDLVGAVTEQITPSGNLTDTGSISFTDVDLTDVHLVSASGTYLGSDIALGTLSAVKTADTTGTGSGGALSWTYTVADSAVEYLAKDQTRVESFTLTLNDQNGSIITKQIDVTITGTNDVPVITAEDLVGAVTEQVAPSGNLTDTGSISFTDVDLTDVHLVSASGTYLGSDTALGTLSAVKTADTTGTGSGGALSWTYTVADSAVEYLAKDQTRVESFTLTLNDQNGSIITKQIDVTITGTNDAPVIDAITQSNLVEQTDTAALSTSIAMSFADVDLSNTGHTASVTAVATGVISGLALDAAALAALVTVGTVTKAADSTAGSLTPVFSAASSAFDYLSAGEVLTLTYMLSVNDQAGGVTSKDFIVTVTGTNDAPVITAETLVGAVTEQVTPNGNLDVTSSISFADVDLTDVHLVSATGTSASTNLGTLSAEKTNDTTGMGSGGALSWTYTVADSAVEYLAKGQTRVESFTITLNDQNGSVITKQIDVTITGTNDAPVITVQDLVGAVTEQITPNGNLSDSGSITFSDVDLTDVHLVSADGTAGTTNLGTLTATLDTDTTGSGTGGVLSWTYTVADSAVEYLAKDQTRVESFTITLNDQNGSIITKQIDVTITGTNDALVITAEDLVGAVTEQVTPSDNLSDSGIISFSDVDLTDVHLVSAIGAPVDTVLGTLTAVKTADTTGSGTGGALSWTYTVADSAVEHLAKDQTRVESFTLTLDDQNGSIITKQIDVTITGTNDVPTLAHPLINQSLSVAGPIATYTFAADTFADIDQGTVLSYTAQAWDSSTSTASTLPAWLLFDANTRTFSGNPPAGSPSLTVRVTASDGMLTTTGDFSITLPESVGNTVSLPAPLGDVVVVNDLVLPQTLKVTDVTDNSKVTTTGKGNTTVDAPAGNVNIDNAGTGTTNIAGLKDDKTVTTSGNGPTTVENPTGNVTVANTGDGDVKVNGANDGNTVTTSGDKPVTVSNPDGDVTVNNTDTGLSTVTDVKDGKTVTTSGTGPTTIENPAGDVTVANTGDGDVKVNGANDGKTVTTSGDKPVTVSNPDGDVTVNNTGTGPSTVIDVKDGKTVIASGSGPVMVSSAVSSPAVITINTTGNQSNVTADNDGTGTTNVTGLLEGASLKSTGNGGGSTNVVNPVGNLTLENTGLSPVNISGFDNDKKLDLSGAGATNVNSPDGNLTLNNTGSGPATINELATGKTVTVPTTSTGPTTIANPVGDVNVDNTGTGIVTVAGVHEGGKLTTTGNHDVTVSSPAGNVVVDNNGTGTDLITGLQEGKTVSTHGTGTGTTTVENPAGDVTVANTGNGLVKINGANDNATVTATGTKPVTISNPDGNVNVVNDGTGLVTVSGVLDGSTVHSTGSGPQTVDLSNLVSGQSVTIDNDGTGLVNLIHVPDGVTVHFTGTDPTTVSSLSGHVTLDNQGTSLVTVANDATIANGSTIDTTGTGPIKFDTDIPTGNTVHVDIAGNNKVTFDNDGAGTLDVTGATNAILTSTSSGQITVTDPVGNLTVNNTGNGPLVVSGLDTGKVLTVNGNGPTEVKSPDGDVTVINNGTGLINIKDVLDGKTIHAAGTGPIVINTELGVDKKIIVDLTGNHNVQITNTGGGVVESQGDLTLDSTHALAMTLTGKDMTVLTETGTVALNNAPLRLNLAANYTPMVGEIITLIANDSTDAVFGTFAGLPEGTVVHVGAYQFTISYVGGSDHNDVILTVNSAPTGSVFISGTPTQGDTLTATNTLADINVIPTSGTGAISYQWQADGVAINGATASTFVLTQAQVAKAVNVVASYIDGIGSHESQVSTSTMVHPTASGSTPLAQQSVVSTVAITPTGSSTASVVSLALNTGLTNGVITDSIVVSQHAGTAITTPSVLVAPVGVFDLSSHGNTTGGENFSLYVDKSLAVNGYWVQNASGTFVNLASAAFGGSTVIEGDKIRLDFTIQDGGQFDTTNTAGTAHGADGVITASGAAAHMELSIIGHAADVPTGGVFF